MSKTKRILKAIAFPGVTLLLIAWLIASLIAPKPVQSVLYSIGFYLIFGTLITIVGVFFIALVAALIGTLILKFMLASLAKDDKEYDIFKYTIQSQSYQEYDDMVSHDPYLKKTNILYTHKRLKNHRITHKIWMWSLDHTGREIVKTSCN